MKTYFRYLSVFLLTFCLSIGAFAQAKELPDFADLAEKHGPAVVNISITQVIKNDRLGSFFGQPFSLDENDPAFEFFAVLCRRVAAQASHHGNRVSLESCARTLLVLDLLFRRTAIF